MLTILCPASRRLDYLTLLAMGPGRRNMGIRFFVFSFFWLALGSSFFETLKRRGNTVKRSSQS